MDTSVVLRTNAPPAGPPLVLRPWRTADVAALVEAFEDPALRRWTSHSLNDEAEGARWVEAQQQAWADGARFGFAVVEEQPGGPQARLLGNVVLKDVATGKAAAEVGYWTVAHARGRGVAPRALQALTGWAFATFAAVGLDRLELLHQADNRASCRVAEKTGYAHTGTLPAAPPAFPLDGHLHVRRRAEESC